MHTKSLPVALTSYDLLKALALVLMVADHVGYFFFPENADWRVAGRLSVPVWFFLIGYARSREVPAAWWAGAVALSLSSLVAGETLFPLNILFTLALARLLIDGIMVRALRRVKTLVGMMLLMICLALPALALVEYGTLGLMFAMFGFMCRHHADLRRPVLVGGVFFAASAVSYFLIQAILMPSFTAPQLLGLAAGLAGMGLVLWAFRPAVFPGFDRIGGFIRPVLQFLGRRTLEIYVIHLLVFRALAMALDPERFALLDFTVFPPMIRALFGAW